MFLIMRQETPMWALPLMFFVLGAIVMIMFVLIYSSLKM